MTDLINYRDPDVVFDELLSVYSSLQPNINISESSMLNFILRSVAVSLTNNGDMIKDVSDSAFIDKSTGDNLTSLAKDRGVTRELAELAILDLTLTRAVTGDAISIPASSEFSTVPDNLGDVITFKTFDEAIIDASNFDVSTPAQAVDVGDIGNVPVDTITQFISSINGVDTVTNSTSGVGGVNEESDDDLRERVRSVLANNTGKVTVGGYSETLKTFDGVETASVFAGTGAMPNEIIAILTTDETSNKIPTAEQLALWQIEINKDDNRAVADNINLFAPVEVPVAVSATITEYAGGSDISSTNVSVQSSVISYINGLAPSIDVRKVDISNIIHDNDGVNDFILHAPTTNITVDNFEKATTNSANVNIS